MKTTSPCISTGFLSLENKQAFNVVMVYEDYATGPIAQRVGATFSRVGQHTSAVTYGYWSDLATDGYEWIFRPNACSGVIPTNDGQACVFASASPERINRGGVALQNNPVDRDIAPVNSPGGPPVPPASITNVGGAPTKHDRSLLGKLFGGA